MSSADLPYCPDRGDLVEIDFDPQSRREQAGRRPALVLSPASYNRIARLCVLFPVTNQRKGYPFEVPVGTGHAVTGVILADQVKSLSWTDRRCRFLARAPEAVITEARAKLKALIGT